MRARIPCARPFGRFGCWMLSATSLCWAICWSSVRSPGRRTRKLEHLRRRRALRFFLPVGPNQPGWRRQLTRRGIAQCFYAADKNGLLEELLRTLQPGDAVLFKASRGMRFEELIEAIYEGWKIK